MSDWSNLMDSDLLDCGECGGGLRGQDPRPGYYADGESIVCPDCGATNSVTIEDEGDGLATYIGSWSCKHGKADDEPCDQCEEFAV